MTFLLIRRAACGWLTLALSLLSAAPFFARAALVSPDFQIGPDISLDSLSVATSGTNYLVVWRDLSSSATSTPITGAFVSSTGVASAGFTISDALGAPQKGPVQRARVAFNSVNFLVVWHDTRSLGSGVRGAFVSPQGMIVGGADFLIATTANTKNINPQVSYSGGVFFVAWQDAPMSGSGTQVYYATVSPSAIPSMPKSIPFPAATSTTEKFEFLVPGQNGENLIVYQDTGSSPNATYAIRVASDTTVTGPASGTQIFTNDFSPGGAGAPIGGAYLSDTQEYLLLASWGTQLSCGVSRAWLKSDGRISLATAPFALVGQGATTLEEANFPLAVFNGSNEFIFPRNSKASDVAYHILMKRVNVNGTDNDPQMAVVDEATTGILNGATACAINSLNQYIVVWMDGRRRVTDPPLQTNVYGAIVDTTQAGNTLRPYIRPGAAIVPQVGAAPLTIATSGGTSTGLIDSGGWDFGDGTTSVLFSTTHKYVNAGSYLAVYSLNKAGLQYNEFFHIDVGSTDVGGANGPPQSVGGVIGNISSGVNTGIVLSSFSAALNFVKTGADSFHLVGKFDVTRIPVYLTGQHVKVTLGTNVYAFDLLADGTFTSTTGTTPFLTFQLASINGVFAMNAASDKLLAALSGSGVSNTTASKLPVSIPISISFAGMSTTQSIQAQYTAKVGASGTLNYSLGTTGATGDGYFGVSSGYATERLTNGKTGDMIHDFGAIGNLTLPGSATLVKSTAPNGIWRVRVGNYSESIPVSAVTLSGTTYSYLPKGVKIGITQFAYNQKSGGYILLLKAIPATGEDASGMAISTDQITRADIAVAVDLDLDGGAKFQAGQFLRLIRKDVTKSKWTLR